MKTINPDLQPIVLAHDAFTQYGGAERVFEATVELIPDAPVYTLVKGEDDKAGVKDWTKGWRLITSPLQALYNLYPHLTHLFFLIPVVLKFWGPAKAKVLFTFSSAYIKGLRKPKGTVHINYCHTPTRFLWIDPEHAYKEIPSFLHPIAKLYFNWLKKWDLRAASQVDYFIANSKEVQQRIKTVYSRDSEIIYPFVDTEYWKPSLPKQDYFLIAGRLQYAKGLEMVIAVFNDLGWPLHVVGSGRFEQTLRSLAKDNITFLGRTNDDELRNQYSGAKGFIYPQFEDFGMMPLEAAACGTATLGLAKGGSLETIVPGVTGELLTIINEQTLKEALLNWKSEKYQQQDLLHHAQKFNKLRFQEQIISAIEQYGASGK